jgi:two-component system heavy metal sensor histidine kinase CusS
MLIGYLRREQDAFLADKVRVVREMLLKHPDNLADLNEEVEQTFAPRQYARALVRVIDPSGKVISESPRMSDWLDSSFFPPLTPSGDYSETVSLWGTQGSLYRVVTARAQIGADPHSIATLQVALSTQVAHELLVDYRQTLLWALGVGLASCAIAGYWVGRVGLGPLREIAATTQRITSTNLRERLDPRRLPSELSVLGQRFNDMMGRLEDSFTRLSRFSADIAHEMRTPVNNMRLELEVKLGRARSLDEYRETLGSCLEECGRLSRIIDSMLFIARAEDPRTQINRETVDMWRELHHLQEYFEVPASEAGIDLQISCPKNLSASLDRMLFQRAMSNLVSNALRYTPRGGKVIVSAAIEQGELRFAVKDTGAGIATDDLPHIFDRFFRAEQARSSSAGNVGLGLAIVKSIVMLHGGTVSAHSTVNAGTTMELRVPVASEAPSAKNPLEQRPAPKTQPPVETIGSKP